MGAKISSVNRSSSGQRVNTHADKQQLQQARRSAPGRSPYGRRHSAPNMATSPCASRSPSPIHLASPGHHWANRSSLPAPRVSFQFGDDAIIDNIGDAPEPEEEVSTIGPIAIQTRLEYTSLQKNASYNVFGLVSLQAADVQDGPKLMATVVEEDDSGCNATVLGEHELLHAPAERQRPAIDVTCVLDVSGSMSGQKLQLVKEAVMFIIDEMLDGDRLSIVSFNHGAQRHTALSRMNGLGKDAARQAVVRLTSGGGTSIAAGLDCGIAVMEQRRQRNSVGALFLLTDGQDGTSRHQIQELISRARSVQCGVYAFGFGADHDTSTLSTIAESAMTPFTFVESPDTIKQAFAGAVGGLMSVSAQNIELRIVPDGGTTVAALHTHFTHRLGEDGTAVVQIPDAFAGERRDVVVELSVPALSSDSSEGRTPLLRASAKYRAVRERTLVQTPEESLYAARTQEPEGEPDIEVTTQRQRIEVTNALEQAIAHGQEGKFEVAQDVLQQNINKLRSNQRQTDVTTALLGELNDAHSRLKSARDWNDGGLAEVTDAMWMHRNQRCTTAVNSKSNRVQKCSKQLYLRSSQRASIARSGLS